MCAKPFDSCQAVDFKRFNRLACFLGKRSFVNDPTPRTVFALHGKSPALISAHKLWRTMCASLMVAAQVIDLIKITGSAYFNGSGCRLRK
jgi:hypothetical protein